MERVKKQRIRSPKRRLSPVEIEFEGIKHRLHFLTDFKLNASAESIRPNSKTLIFRAAMTGQQNLWSLSLEEDKRDELPKQLTGTANGKGNVHFIPNGKKFYYTDGGRIHSVGMGEDGAKEGDAKALDTRAEVEVNFHLEKMQAFDEAWRLIRDGFYDPQFHGCDWEQIRQTFRPMVEGVHTQEEFRELLNLMVGELNASHLGAGGAEGQCTGQLSRCKFRSRNVGRGAALQDFRNYPRISTNASRRTRTGWGVSG